MNRTHATSGDLIADRRYAYGEAAFEEGDFSAARDLFAQTIEQAPGWACAHHALGRALLALGEAPGARAALEEARRLDPADTLGAGVLLARLAGQADASAMPDRFVATLFDGYAPRFDVHLVEALAYRAPALIAERVLAAGPVAGPVLDLGCGTGLMARALAGQGEWHGVDLSGAMLAVARESRFYCTLAQAELRHWLSGRAPGEAALVLAADVFCYVPELEPVFAEVARVLAPNGRFAFTVQTHGGTGAIMGADSRVHHAPALVRALGAGAGLRLIHEQMVSTRRDRGADVPGALYLFAR